ncbi:unnamed protein product [Lactuca virosa]|uniref:F-box domain-containing protein n=1 Tax=Lactuca virosa TaxID=75947 RepID=A0AAU9LFV2_9ASTR|nr:unnamed protein product [Lactuca virosa]
MAELRPPRNTITRNLPQEILFFQILLPRLPVKALPNAMCVCKKWYLFLKSGTGKSQYSDKSSGLLLWNPLTDEYKNLSNKGCHDKECYTTIEQGRGTLIKSYSVMRFHTKTEEFTEIAMPSFGNQMTRCLGFMVLRGCIHFCIVILIGKENDIANRQCSEMIELWRMDGDKDWTKVLTYGPMSFSLLGGSILHFMRNGNLLLQNEGNVYVFDMKKDTKEIVFTCHPINPPNMYEAHQRRMDCDIPPLGKYIEIPCHPIGTPYMYVVTPSY